MEHNWKGPQGCHHDEYDLGRALDLANQVIRCEIKQRPPTIGHDYPHIYCPANRENVRIIKQGERVIATVGIFPSQVVIGGRQLVIGGINCLATDPEYRRAGLGTQLMQDALEHMRRLGCHVSLLGTQISDFYRTLGWEYGGMDYSFAINWGTIGLLEDEVCETVDYDETMQNDVLALYHSEHVGAIRNSRLGQLYFNGHKGTEALVGLERGTPQAYILAKDDTVVEYAGERAMVRALVRNWLNRSDKPGLSRTDRSRLRRAAVHVHVPPADAALLSWFEQRGIPREVKYQGMFRILDLPGMLQVLGLDAVTAEEQPPDRYRLQYRGEAEEFNQRDLVKLFFGPERMSGFARDLLPVPLYQWSLDHV